MSKPTFEEYLAKYPEINMPVTLGEDTHHTFGVENEPFTEEFLEHFILPLTTEQPDEFTEYMPCFRIADTEGFLALVYWKAALLTYEYTLVTYSPKWELIAHKVIAQTRVEGQKIIRTVATIDDELIIFIAEGAATGEEVDFDPTTTKTYNMEILMNGEIIQYGLRT